MPPVYRKNLTTISDVCEVSCGQLVGWSVDLVADPITIVFIHSTTSFLIIDMFCLFLPFSAVQTASKSLTEAIAEVYESQWTGAEALNSQVSNIDVLWQDFAHKLGDQVLIPLNTYTAQFPEMKVRPQMVPTTSTQPNISIIIFCSQKKIEKRNRKLIDYDGQRHSFQSLQASSAKRKDDVKVK